MKLKSLLPLLSASRYELYDKTNEEYIPLSRPRITDEMAPYGDWEVLKISSGYRPYDMIIEIGRPTE